ncbi:hypothetical protein C8F01DRAFT_1109132 [Mycena amicta]|nr:hypothetical protein C8F01DRAFT_1109132 [Mycena amicta]
MSTSDERQCRICLAGQEEEPELGRLIKPCLCTGRCVAVTWSVPFGWEADALVRDLELNIVSIRLVHIKCLQRWRTSSAGHSRFFSCPQCKYNYRFARTKFVGLATNPVIVGTLSAFMFTFLVILSSFITTFFMSWFEEPSYSSYYYSRSSSFFAFSPFFVSPVEVVQDIIRAALRILQDEDSETFGHTSTTSEDAPYSEPGIIRSLIRRFFLGLPIVGASSVVQMLLSLQVISPVHFLARYRSSNRRREGSRDLASLLIITLILVGAARALIKVYSLTESLTKRVLLRAEDAILEV